MKKKKEFIERLINMRGCGAKWTSWERGWDDAISDVIRIAEELEDWEQTDTNVGLSKPVIPQFVADYIELNKGWSEDRQEYAEDDSSGLWFALNGDNQGMPNSVSDWLFNEEKVETFAKAWLDGYEVEKEKKYYVLNNCRRTILVKFFGKQIAPSQGMKLEDIGNNNSDYQFTEQEIKNYDKRYWQFAEEVTE